MKEDKNLTAMAIDSVNDFFDKQEEELKKLRGKMIGEIKTKGILMGIPPTGNTD